MFFREQLKEKEAEMEWVAKQREINEKSSREQTKMYNAKRTAFRRLKTKAFIRSRQVMQFPFSFILTVKQRDRLQKQKLEELRIRRIAQTKERYDKAKRDTKRMMAATMASTQRTTSEKEISTLFRSPYSFTTDTLLSDLRFKVNPHRLKKIYCEIRYMKH